MFRALLVWWCLLFAARGEVPPLLASTPGKLPRDVFPRHYRVHLTPDVASAKVTGEEGVQVTVCRPVQKITLNAAGLKVLTAKVRSAGRDLTPIRIETDEAAQLLTLHLAEEVPAGEAEVELSWEAALSRKTQGLFLTPYEENGATRLALATQMEPADARRMLPCWDEPIFRAVFELSVTVPREHLALSNMPVAHDEPAGEGKKTVHFAPAPAMSSYLLALAVGDFETLEDEAAGVKLRIVTTRGKAAQGRYALDATKEILAWYAEYFGTPYPLPKLDQFCFPGFPAGGMENWGAIFYHDTALLVDPRTASRANKQRVFDVVAHELAHQWFGDLVTMAWWDNLWLNEGFASWMGLRAAEHFHPEWEEGLRAFGAREAAMYRDARRTTHPIQQPVRSEHEANEAFDEITYSKGMSFLRMLEQYLGEERFRDGIRLYFRRHAMSNTTTADLWAALEEASGQPVRTLAAGWTEQPGFPLVRVEGSSPYTLRQERFRIRQPQVEPLTWQIPLVAAWTGTPAQRERQLLGTEPLELPAGAGTLKLNAGGLGFYRVMYEPATWTALMQGAPRLPAADRLNLLGDSWALAQGGYTTAAPLLDLLRRIAETEESPAVCSEVLGRLEAADALLRGSAVREPFRQWARGLVRHIRGRLGWVPKPQEPALAASLRAQLFEALGTWGDPAVGATAAEWLDRYRREPASVPGDLRRAVFFVAGQQADSRTWEDLLSLARRAASTQEKSELYRALAAARAPALAEKTLALALTDERPPNEITRLFSHVAGEGEQADLAWRFAREHHAALVAKLSASSAQEFLARVASFSLDATRADELERWASEHLGPETRQAVAKAADHIRCQADFRARLEKQVTAWLYPLSPAP